MHNIDKIIRPYCYKIIPLIYDDSLSYYEVLCKLREKLNEVIDKVNLLEDPTEDIKEEVDKILNGWLEDGTIEKMISQALLSRQSEVMHIQPEYISTFNYPCGAFRSTVSYDVIQSFCFIGNDECVAVRNQRNWTNNQGKVFKFSAKNGLATTPDYTFDIGHGNDVCFDGEYIYIAWLYAYSNGSVDSTKITVLDTNLNFVKYIELSGMNNIIGLDYNPTEEQFYVFNNASKTFFVYDKNLENVVKEIHVNFDYFDFYDLPAGRTLVNTISCLENSLLLNVVAPNMSVEVDYDGNVVRIINYADFVGNGAYIGEIEKVTFNKNDGNFYMFIFGVQGLGDYANNTFCKYNLKKGHIERVIPTRTTRPYLYAASQRIYVKNDIPSNARMLGTFQYPFKYLQQAIECFAHIPENALVLVINPDSVQDLGTVSMARIDDIRIDSIVSSYNSQGELVWTVGTGTTVTRSFIPRMDIIQCSNVEVFNMNCEQLVLGNCGSLQFGNCRCNGNGAFRRCNNIMVLSSNVFNSVLAINVTFTGRVGHSNEITFTEESYNHYDIGTAIPLNNS